MAATLPSLRTLGLALDDFALFARVAELRNLSAVAREREVPPSQVSRALARIERRCGARLVHRTTHGLSLTEEGEAVAAHGAQVLAIAEALEADLDERRGDPSGLVRIATSPAMALHLLPCIDRLLEAHPRLRIELAAADQLLDMARDGIDIAVRIGAAGAEGLVARPLGDHARGLYAAPAYLERHGEPADPQALARHRLIGNSAAPALNRWRFRVDGAPFELRAGTVLRTDNSGITLALALRGVGIARLLEPIAAPHVAAGRLVPLLEAFAERAPNPIQAVMLPDRQRLPKVRACVDGLADWFAGR